MRIRDCPAAVIGNDRHHPALGRGPALGAPAPGKRWPVGTPTSDVGAGPRVRRPAIGERAAGPLRSGPRGTVARDRARPPGAPDPLAPNPPLPVRSRSHPVITSRPRTAEEWSAPSRCSSPLLTGCSSGTPSATLAERRPPAPPRRARRTRRDLRIARRGRAASPTSTPAPTTTRSSRRSSTPPTSPSATTTRTRCSPCRSPPRAGRRSRTCWSSAVRRPRS